MHKPLCAGTRGQDGHARLRVGFPPELPSTASLELRLGQCCAPLQPLAEEMKAIEPCVAALEAALRSFSQQSAPVYMFCSSTWGVVDVGSAAATPGLHALLAGHIIGE